MLYKTLTREELYSGPKLFMLAERLSDQQFGILANQSRPAVYIQYHSYPTLYK